MTTDLSWMITRNTNAFLSKKANIKKPFSKVCNFIHHLVKVFKYLTRFTHIIYLLGTNELD